MSKVNQCIISVANSLKGRGLSQKQIGEKLKEIDELAKEMIGDDIYKYDEALESIMGMPQYRKSEAARLKVQKIKEHFAQKKIKSTFFENYKNGTDKDFGHHLANSIDAKKTEALNEMSASFGKLLSTKFINENGGELKMGDWYDLSHKNKQIQKNFADEMLAISKDGQTGVSGDVGAGIYARWVMDTRAKWRNKMFDMGADIRLRNDYQGSQNLSQMRLLKVGEQGFIDVMIGRIDWDATFGFKKSSNKQKISFLKKTYKDITTYEGSGYAKGMYLEGVDDINSNSLAARYEKSRTIVYANNDSYIEVMNEIGEGGSVLDVAMEDLRKLVHDGAIINTMGANPAKTYRSVVKDLGFEKQNTFFSNDAIFKNITGEANAFGSTKRAVQTAQALGGTRNAISVAFLGEVAIASFSELANGNALLSRSVKHNRGVINSITDTFKTIKDPEDKRLFAQLINLEAQAKINNMGGGLNRYGDVLEGGFTGRMLNRLYGYSQMRNMESHQKDAIIGRVTSTWHSNKGKSFNDLQALSTDDLKPSKFGVTEDMWNFFRSLDSLKDQNGNLYLTTDAIHNVDGGRIAKEYLKKPDASARRIEKARDEVITAFNSYLIRMAETGMLTPNARDMSVINFGYKRGTIPGEALRTTMHLTTFPVMALTRTVAPIVQGREFATLAMYMAYATTLGYASMVTRDMLRGRYRDYLTDDPALQAKMWTEAFARGGAGTIFFDLLYQYFKYGDGVTDRVGGLSFVAMADAFKFIENSGRVAYDLATTGGSDMDASLEKFSRDTIRDTRKYIPFGTLPVIRQILDNAMYMGLNQVSPDTTRKLEDYWEQETGGGYYFDISG